MTHKIQLTVAFTPRMARLLLVAVLVTAVAVELGSETLTMTTTYPSPAGIYRSLVTTGGVAGGTPYNTDLARQTGMVTIGANQSQSPTIPNVLSVNGSATVGNSSYPTATLTVNGNATVSGTATIPSGGNLTIANGATLNINKSVKDSAGNTGSAGQALALSSTGGATWQTIGGGGTSPSCSWALAAVGYSGPSVAAAGCSPGYNAYSIACYTTGPSALKSFGYQSGVGWSCIWNGGPNGNSNNMYLLCCNF
jgi:hypothetical protein